MLTIIGYSINASIVIFDRIRENLGNSKKHSDEALKEIVNRSITQTLTRSIYTSLTTFITIAALFILGVPSIREFAFSSVCISGPLWYILKTKFKSKNK